jgi:hypothetical protein
VVVAALVVARRTAPTLCILRLLVIIDFSTRPPAALLVLLMWGRLVLLAVTAIIFAVGAAGAARLETLITPAMEVMVELPAEVEVEVLPIARVIPQELAVTAVTAMPS